MQKIGEHAAKCLATATKYGEVIIITNSDEGWVQFSAERYVPNLIPVISNYRIVSARTSYEKFYPGQPLCWKAAAFAHEVNESFAAYDRNTPASPNKDNDPFLKTSFDDTLVSTDAESSDDSLNEDERDVSPRRFHHRMMRKMKKHPIKREVISFGDSIEERTAVKIVSGQLSATAKSVMFLSSPTPEQLIGQLSMLTAYMKYVCEHPDSLDLEISPDQAEKCADSLLRKKGNNNNSIRSTGSKIRCGIDDLSKENLTSVGDLNDLNSNKSTTYSI